MTNKKQKIDEIIDNCFYDKSKCECITNEIACQYCNDFAMYRQQFKQSLYNRIKEIMEEKKFYGNVTYEIVERLKIRDETITECIEAFRKELGVKE